MKKPGLLMVFCAVALTAFAEGEATFDQAKTRAAVLRREIARHSELYFRKAAPEITDAQYDALKQELQSLAEKYPGLAPETGLGDDRLPGFPSYRHRVPVLGLGKTHTEAGVKAFCLRLQQELGRKDLIYLVEPKYDGLSISVTYESGRLTHAVTRGNGMEGDEVTANLLALSDLPTRFAASNSPVPELIELRGEVYMAYAEFKRINQEREVAGEEPFAHPRNLAAGTLRQQEADVSPRRLKVAFYGMGAVLPAGRGPRSQQELHARLKTWGLPGASEIQVAHTADEAWAAVEILGRRRAALPFPIDGAVVKLDDLQLQAKLGATEEGPRGALAYKYPPTTVTTRLVGITLQIGRTGLVAPIAELEPVKIGGTTIRRATLHNRAEIARKDLRIGDWIFLEKAGEIIPAITGVDAEKRPAGLEPFRFPESCPVCEAKLVADGPAIRCPNYECRAQLQRRLEHFVSTAAVDIGGFGKATLAALVDAGLLKQPADLYALEPETLRTVTSEKNAEKLLAAIAASRTRERWRFIYALGVPDIGPAAAKAIAKQFTLAAWIAAQESDYRASAISAAARRASLEFFSDERRRGVAEALDRVIKPEAR